VSEVRTNILGMELSRSATTTDGLATASPADRQVVADAIRAGASYLITTDVDDFAVADLADHRLSAVNPDYFMALRFTEYAYRTGISLLAEVAKNPPRTEADVHRMLGRRHPRLVERFAGLYDVTPVPADPDQPGVLFRGASCLRCGALLEDDGERMRGLCARHSNA
jgi:hypothetical protein